jgi:DNA modification methylase
VTDLDERVRLGDCLDVMRGMPDNSVHAIVTDPPYGLAEHKRVNVEKALLAWLTGDREHVPNGRGFMGREWDAFVPPPAVWDECFRVLKPGGHLLAFCGSRTIDLMMMSVRLAGLTEEAAPEIRDSIAWLYGSGMPKSWNFETQYHGAWCVCESGNAPVCSRCGGLDPAFKRFGTGIKPGFEPVVVARKPLVGSVAGNVQEWGTGALNIDACRVGTNENLVRPATYPWFFTREYQAGQGKRPTGEPWGRQDDPTQGTQPAAGRWPANVVLDGSQADALDHQSGPTGSWAPKGRALNGSPDTDSHLGGLNGKESPHYGDYGSGASRFFPTFRYQAKAPTAERPTYTTVDGRKVSHPTVKPLDLMRWLVKLVTPPGGTVLDPFAGSGATLEACLIEGFDCIAIEREADYLPLIQQRIDRQGDALPFDRPA